MTPRAAVKRGLCYVRYAPRHVAVPKPAPFSTSLAGTGWRPAPRFCPTIVAAALLIPNAGRSAKTMMRMPIVYPASAELPKTEMMRTMPT